MLKMRAMLCFIWEMQVFKLDQNFVLASKCEHFGTPYFYHAISLRHFDTCCMKYSWKLINSPKISFSLFLYLEKCAFENGRKWPSPRHREGVFEIWNRHIFKSTRDIELKFLVWRSIMPYNVITQFEQIWRGSSWDILKNQDVWHGMTRFIIYWFVRGAWMLNH